MPELEVVGARIMEIDGVSGYIVATSDGHMVLSQNVDDPEKLASSMALSTMTAESLKQTVGLTKLKHFMFTSDGSGDLVIILLKKYLIGIMKENETPMPDVLKGFRNIFK